MHFQMVTIDPVVFAAGANGTPIVFFVFSTEHESPFKQHASILRSLHSKLTAVILTSQNATGFMSNATDIHSENHLNELVSFIVLWCLRLV